MSDVLFGNNNKAVIKKVANRNFHSNKKRNILAVIAIALTTFLLTAVLTIGFGAKNTLQYRGETIRFASRCFGAGNDKRTGRTVKRERHV